jgi:Holliday junction resolvase RusA-like endonuclease
VWPAMTGSVYFVVTGKPVGKGRPRASTRGGFVRMYTDAKTLGYEAAIADEAARAMSGAEPFETPMQMQVSCYYPIPKSWPKKIKQGAIDEEVFPKVKPDLDNVVKAVLDALNGVVYLDDAQVVNLVATKRYATEPRVEVYVFEKLK